MQPTPPKVVLWKISLGLFLIYKQIHSVVSPSPGSFIPNGTPAQSLGYNSARLGVLVLALWLVYSGAKPLWRKSL
jgi:hypothetical protein